MTRRTLIKLLQIIQSPQKELENELKNNNNLQCIKMFTKLKKVYTMGERFSHCLIEFKPYMLESSLTSPPFTQSSTK